MNDAEWETGDMILLQYRGVRRTVVLCRKGVVVVVWNH